MTVLTFPCALFTTQRKINDTTPVDMRYGDLTASRLRQQYYLADVSEKIDSYILTELTPFDLPQSRFYLAERKHYSRQECAEMMFNKVRSLSWPLQKKFNQFRFFRLWFVLQRYQQLGYKPFFTNMDITVEVAGEVK